MILEESMENKYRRHEIDEYVSRFFNPGRSTVSTKRQICSFVTDIVRSPTHDEPPDFSPLIDWKVKSTFQDERLLFLDIVYPEQEWNISKYEMMYLTERYFVLSNNRVNLGYIKYRWEFSPNQPYYKFINIEQHTFQYVEQSIILASLDKKNFYELDFQY